MITLVLIGAGLAAGVAAAAAAPAKAVSDPTTQNYDGISHNSGGYRGGGYRGGYYGYYGGGSGWDGFAAGAILGGVVAAPYYQGSLPDSAVACMRRFKSYEPRSGTYLGYDGYRHPCP
jgi:hypothetical protein